MVATLSLLVFMILPGSLYLGNLDEFMTAPGALAGLLLIPALLSLVAVMIGLRLSRRKNLSLFSAVLAAITLLVWVQSYLLVRDYGLLDGSPIDWSTPAWRGWVDLSTWIAGLTVAVVFHRRLEQPLTTAAFVVVALQATMVFTSGLANRDILSVKATRRAAANSLEAMARFSPERNVLHIVLDSFQADVFKDILEGPAGPHFRSAFTGFTFFEEHVGTFPATHFALPAIVSGQVYRNHVPRPEFMESVFQGKTILNAAHDAGFEVDLASDPWMLEMLMKGRFDNAYLTAQFPQAEEAARLFDLALFRLAPHWLKPHVYNDQRWLTQRLITQSDLMRFPYFTHNAFLANITQRLAADREAPVYKFFHLMTTHSPLVVNPDCSYAGRMLVRIRASVTAQSQCSLAFVVALLNRMKQAAIYDHTLIVIMGDHGGHIPPHRYRPGIVVDGTHPYPLSPEAVAMATPLMLVKPAGSTGPFRISSTLTSMTDTAATIDLLLGLGAGLPGGSMLDEGRHQTLERRFYGYSWSGKDAVSDYIGTITEFTISGSAYDVQSWRPTGRFDGGER